MSKDESRLFGRASATEAKGVTVFAQLFDAGGLPQPITQQLATWVEPPCGEDRLWSIGSSLEEALRFSAVPVPPSGPAFGGDRSGLELLITASGSHGRDTYAIDLGQWLEVYASSITVGLWGPPASSVARAAIDQSGLLADTSAIARILKIETSRGARSADLTRTIFVDSNATATVPIPTAARSLSVYTSSVTDFEAQWYRGNPADGGLSMGRLVIPEGSGERVPAPSATHLLIPAVNPTRVVSFVWEIRP